MKKHRGQLYGRLKHFNANLVVLATYFSLVWGQRDDRLPHLATFKLLDEILWTKRFKHHWVGPTWYAALVCSCPLRVKGNEKQKHKISESCFASKPFKYTSCTNCGIPLWPRDLIQFSSIFPLSSTMSSTSSGPGVNCSPDSLAARPIAGSSMGDNSCPNPIGCDAKFREKSPIVGLHPNHRGHLSVTSWHPSSRRSGLRSKQRVLERCPKRCVYVECRATVSLHHLQELSKESYLHVADDFGMATGFLWRRYCSRLGSWLQ